MSRHVVTVFDTMLSLAPVFTGPIAPPTQADRVIGSIGFGGDSIAGAVYLHLSSEMAAQATALMLGMPPNGPAPSESEINDGVSELANMLCGALKSWLSDTVAPCSMSIPSIIRGASFQIEPSTGVECICLSFKSAEESIFVEIHYKEQLS